MKEPLSFFLLALYNFCHCFSLLFFCSPNRSLDPRHKKWACKKKQHTSREQEVRGALFAAFKAHAKPCRSLTPPPGKSMISSSSSFLRRPLCYCLRRAFFAALPPSLRFSLSSPCEFVDLVLSPSSPWGEGRRRGGGMKRRRRRAD